MHARAHTHTHTLLHHWNRSIFKQCCTTGKCTWKWFLRKYSQGKERSEKVGVERGHVRVQHQVPIGRQFWFIPTEGLGEHHRSHLKVIPVRQQKSWTMSVPTLISHWLRAVPGGKGHKFSGASGSLAPSSRMLASVKECTLEFSWSTKRWQRDPRWHR